MSKPQSESIQQDFVGYEDDDPCSNPAPLRPIGEIIEARLNRRGALKTLAASAAGLLAGPAAAALAGTGKADPGPSSLAFEEVPHGLGQDVSLARGYEMQVLLRWGDAVLSGAPPFDARKQSPEAQERQFGYNCDFIAFLPLPRGSKNPGRGLLCVNHEYTNTNLMFPGVASREALENLPREMVEAEMAAHGHSVVEVEKRDGRWRAVAGSRYNRRISALAPSMRISGPAAGHRRLKTGDDPTGRRAIGTLNNCAGGVTPWGTVLISEENFNGYFSGDPEKIPETANHKRYGITGPSRFNPAWAKHHRRFNIEHEPNESNRFGWVVDFDPYDPASVPVKRTALGRIKHEGAGIVLNRDGRVVVYCGDDERFEYAYKFVTRGRYNPRNANANRNLLDEGTLYVAKFHADGAVEWLPLVFGQGPLTSANGFDSQADVVIETRRAADLLGATPMDRPEDVEPSPTSGRVYLMLSSNDKRDDSQVDAANPRAQNVHGHVIEMIPPGHGGGPDHAATTFHWNVLIRCGNPFRPEDEASYHRSVSENGWLSCPDNSAFDGKGRLWITTDGAGETAGTADAVYACDVEGPGRGLTRRFFAGPRGSELSGTCFTPDDTTMFVSVQHPGEEKGSDYANPSTRWPDFDPSTPPRPAVVAITKRDGGPIGS